MSNIDKMPWDQLRGRGFRPQRERAVPAMVPQLYGKSRNDARLNIYLPEVSRWTAERTLVVAAFHGEEPETTNVLAASLRTLTTRALRTAVILCANPDGMAAGTRGNAVNVDLNRNFPASNWQPNTTKTRWELGMKRLVELSPGEQPASEPETHHLIQAIGTYGIKQIVSLHAPLECIDYTQDEDWPLVEALSDGMRLPVQRVGHPTPGSLDAWATEQNIRLVTPEFSDDLALSDMRYEYGPTLVRLLAGELPGL